MFEANIIEVMAESCLLTCALMESRIGNKMRQLQIRSYRFSGCTDCVRGLAVRTQPSSRFNSFYPMGAAQVPTRTAQERRRGVSLVLCSVLD